MNHKIGAGFISLLSSSLTQAICQVVIIAVTSRTLSHGELGAGAVALLMIGLCRNTMTVLVGHSVIQADNISSAGKSSAIFFSLFIGVVLMLTTILFITPWFLEFQISGIVYFVNILSLAILFECIVIPFEALYSRDLDFSYISKANSFSFIFGQVGLTVLMALNEFGAIAIVSGLFVQVCVKFLFLLKSKPIFNLNFSIKELWHLLKFGAPNAVVETMSYMTLTADQIIVGKTLGADSLGIYSRASQLANFPINFFGVGADKVLFASISRLKGDRLEIWNSYKKFIIMMSALALLLSFAIAIFSNEIIDVFLGRGWGLSAKILQCLCVVIFFRLTYKTNDAVMRGLGFVKARFFIQGAFLLLTWFFCYDLTRFGLIGISVGLAVSAGFYLIISTYVVAKLLDQSFKKICFSILRATWYIFLVGCGTFLCKEFDWGIDFGGNDWHSVCITSIGFALMISGGWVFKDFFYGAELVSVVRLFLNRDK